MEIVIYATRFGVNWAFLIARYARISRPRGLRIVLMTFYFLKPKTIIVDLTAKF
jgi:hypothetical protein